MKVALCLLLVLTPASLLAQGLGDTAARERRKRAEKKAPAPAKVYTEQDLPQAAEPVTPTSSDEAPPDAADPLEKEREERKLLQAEWRVRFANAREQLAIAEANSWHEVVRTEFYNGIPVQMKVKEQVETVELKQARQAFADLEEEFRRTGLPPGWARE